jgi:hypothetical protein
VISPALFAVYLDDAINSKTALHSLTQGGKLFLHADGVLIATQGREELKQQSIQFLCRRQAQWMCKQVLAQRGSPWNVK